jgi:predicted outer membrane repeat protein
METIRSPRGRGRIAASLLGAAGLALAALSAPPALAGVYVDCTNLGYENGTPEFPFNTILEGVQAVAEAGTVFVAPCVYEGVGNFSIDSEGKNFALIGTAGPDETIMDCGDAGRGFTFHDGQDLTTLISGLTIQNGNADVGGGVDCELSAVRLADCVFVDCRAGNGGGGVRCSESDGTSFDGCAFIDNTAWWGGAVHVREGSLVSFADVVFTGNSSSEEGGAIDVVKSTVALTDVTFAGNTTVLRGGAYHASGATAPSSTTFAGALFTGNVAQSGGAVSIANGHCSIDGCTFVANSGANGSAVYLNHAPDVTVIRTIMADGLVGEAVHCGSIVPEIRYCCASGNQGGDDLCGDFQDILYTDPHFCDAPGSDFTLYAHSECLPGNNPWGEPIGAFGQGCVDIVPPPVPTGLAALPEDERVFLSWDPSPDPDLDYFILDRDTSVVFGPFTATLNLTGTAHLDHPLENGREYFYRLSARDLAGNVSAQGDTVSCVVGPRPPSAPAGLTAVAGDARVDLSWRSSPETDVTHYAVFRDTFGGFPPGDPLAVTPDTTHLDTEVENYGSYYYVVAAVDTADLMSDPSGEARAVPHGVPPAVTGLVVIPGDTSVTLLWDPMAPPAVDHYEVYRDTVADGHGPVALFDDFESYAPGAPPTNPPWASLAQLGTSIRVTDALSHSGAQSLALADSSAGGQLRMFHVLPDTGRGTEWIECYFRPGGAPREEGLVQCEAIGEDGIGYQAAVWEVRDGFLSHWVAGVGPVALSECGSGVWHHLIWELDCETDTYGITLDDTLVVTEAPFWRDARYLDTIQFRTRPQEPARLWLDDVLWAAGPVAVTSVVDTTFYDAPLESGRRYYYWVTVVDTFGATSPPSDIVEVVVGWTKAGEGMVSLRPSVSLGNPNPFRSGTAITYSVPGRGERVVLRIHDVAGRLVRGLVEEEREGGVHTAVWDGRSDAGHVVASGVYFCRVEIGAWSGTRKLVFVR